ncbi:uncharacterized protein LOC141853470 [Brevipalpus obovatus]|uniref:uncharacterized protein LOC141853470 n=1 Tax=Brevipalpus obovatus TaxID=246614 RepID=UPI003D9EFCA4
MGNVANFSIILSLCAHFVFSHGAPEINLADWFQQSKQDSNSHTGLENELIEDRSTENFPFASYEPRGRRSEMKGHELRRKLITKVAESMGMSPLILLDKLRSGGLEGGKDVLALKDAFVGSRGR